ncbi:MAG: hypothetical protein AAF416_04670 [Pseudomonadota bacterium]
MSDNYISQTGPSGTQFDAGPVEFDPRMYVPDEVEQGVPDLYATVLNTVLQPPKLQFNDQLSDEVAFFAPELESLRGTSINDLAWLVSTMTVDRQAEVLASDDPTAQRGWMNLVETMKMLEALFTARTRGGVDAAQG